MSIDKNSQLIPKIVIASKLFEMICREPFQTVMQPSLGNGTVLTFAKYCPLQPAKCCPPLPKCCPPRVA